LRKNAFSDYTVLVDTKQIGNIWYISFIIVETNYIVQRT